MPGLTVRSTWRSLAAGAALLAFSAQAQGLDLAKAVELALSRNERAAIAGLELEAAQGRLDKARSFFFPELLLGGSYLRRTSENTREVGGSTVTFQAKDALNATATLRWTLFEARLFPLYRVARTTRDATRLESAETRRLIGFEAADAFLATLGAEQVAAAAQRRLTFAKERLAEASARLASRLAGVNDVTRVRLEVVSAERELIRANGAVEQAYEQLGLLLDTRVKPPLTVPRELLESATVPIEYEDSLLNQAEASRLDAAARQQRAKAAAIYATEPYYRLAPSLSFRGQYRLTNEPGLLGRNDDSYLGLDLAWVLFDRTERYADARERRAQAQSAQLFARLKEREIAVELRQALINLQSGQGALRQATAAVEVAKKNAQETVELYAQGLTGVLEVSDASLRMFEAEVLLAREQYGLALAFLELRSALGIDALGREVTP